MNPSIHQSINQPTNHITIETSRQTTFSQRILRGPAQRPCGYTESSNCEAQMKESSSFRNPEVRVERWFSPRGDSVPLHSPGHWARSGDISGCQDWWGEKGPLASRQWRPQIPLDILQHTGQPHPRELPAPKVNAAEVEKPWAKDMRGDREKKTFK